MARVVLIPAVCDFNYAARVTHAFFISTCTVSIQCSTGQTMPFSSTDLESLHRQIRFLSAEVARVERERDKRLNDRELVIMKKNARNERTQKAFSNLRAEHSRLREEAAANVHRTAQLQKEISVLCLENGAAKQRIKDLEEAFMTNPDAKLRLKIKLLCVKYHPDHGTKTLSSTEVARDLIALLA